MPKTNVKSPWWNLWILLSKACTVMAQVDNTDDRSLAATLQNINGMSSIFSLLPVLSGKTQNVKAVAARTFPGTLTIAGLGAGRVLTKLQIGMLLFSADLYRNLVGELAYYHEEYVNKFSPPLIHIPTGTPERHSSNVIVNHNPTEDYMVEAWFQTQGLPAKVELSQTSNQRAFCGLLIYLIIYAFETFLSVQNAATGTAIPLIVLQSLSGICWVAAIAVLQVTRGQGKRFIYLNRLATAEYRCFQLISSGTYVHSALFSTQLSNVREYNLFHSRYECKRLKAVGAAMIASAMIDVIATVLVVGLSPWAYGWLGLQITLIIIKVIFSLEPMRRIQIVNVQALVGDSLPDHGSQVAATSRGAEGRKTRLPMSIETSAEFAFKEVGATHNVVLETATRAFWQSNTPGVFIGQPYYLQRPGLASEKRAASEESVPKLPQLLVPAASEKDEKDEGSDPTIVPLPPSLDHCASPTSAGTDYTVTPASAGFGFVAEVPRIVVSPESSEVASPISPVAPPGIPIARTLSAQTASTRAPTPPAKSSIHRDPSTTPSRPTGPVSTIARNASSTHHSKPDHPHHQFARHPPHGQKTKQKALSPLSSPEPIRYLVQQDGLLTLSEEEPMRETNQALQREFLACLAEIVRANKVASPEFLRAVGTMLEGIRSTMTENWYAFGTTEVLRYVRAAREDIVWRRFV
ncbi:hypothetical protein C8Q80DRAFT_1103280 [Daedaleopsis nitida]|nr:hypothetical protein C8Q80DRAFT_1103280 [Daedaleopsis nitida]